MINLMAETSGCEPFSFGFKPVPVSVLRTDAHFLRPFYKAVLVRNAEAALRAALLPFGGNDLRIEQFNKIRLLTFRNICFQDYNRSPQNADLRCGKTDPVRVEK